MIPRKITSAINENIKKFPVISLTGPRQSGKTTLLKTLFKDYTYYNLEFPDVRQIAEEDPRRFLQINNAKGMIIDEAQRVPHLFSYLQGIVDESKKNGRYLVSGSQNFLLMENITQSLAGRVAIMNLLPFSFNEISESYINEKINIDTVIQRGMYPALYDRNLESYEYYQSYIQTYIERDVRSLKNIGNYSLFSRFIQLCAGRTGQILNKASIASDLGIDIKTITSWLSVLEAGYIIFLLQPYYKNFNKRIIKHPKLFFYDTGLACALLGIRTPAELMSFHLRGELFENYIISDYIKNSFHDGSRPRCYFWRDNTGNEIDLIIENGISIKAAEIKSGMTVNEDFFSNLKKFQRFSGINNNDLFLIYGGKETQERKSGSVIGWKNLNTFYSMLNM